MSPLLRDILRGLVAGEAGMGVVAEYEDAAPLARAVEEQAADVLVFGDQSPRLDEDCREFLETHPRVKLFVVGGDGRLTTLYELSPQRHHLGEVAPEELLAVIRHSVNSRDGW